ncbi:hypothetical protein AURDEDRAFT_40708, partial [Auricularia subglabra TFB-10046 SS5]
WLPHLQVPDRRTLSGPLLCVEKQKAVTRIRSKVQGRLAMLQCDGWKNVARMPVITFMMTVGQQNYLLRSHNMFGQPKTGAKLWELMQLNVTSAQDTYGVESIGICTDDGPDGKCMRRLARDRFPWWIVVVCWAHQIQLMIGDLLKRSRSSKKLIDRAQLVIKWFMAHGTALSLLHDQQLSVPGTRCALMLLLPVVSRWGAQYVSIARLLVLESSVRSVSFSDAYLSRANVRQMCMRVYRRLFRQDATMEFWSACARYFDRLGRFSDEFLSLDFHRDYATRKGKEVDLVLLWQDAQAKDMPNPDDIADQQLVSMAIRILSVVGNSIACEHNFSSFGITHMKIRNSLAVESTHDINFVRMDINARHCEAGL